MESKEKIPNQIFLRSYDEIRQELRQGSEAKHFVNRMTPEGSERVEAIPIDWAIEVIQARDKKLQALVTQREQKLLEQVMEYHVTLDKMNNQIEYYDVQDYIEAYINAQNTNQSEITLPVRKDSFFGRIAQLKSNQQGETHGK